MFSLTIFNKSNIILNLNMDDENERINLAKMKNSSLENQELINKLNRSICKIDINDK
jgi:hypothetical protein